MFEMLKPTKIQLAMWVLLIAGAVIGAWSSDYLLAACALTSAISSMFFTWLYEKKAGSPRWRTANEPDASVTIDISDATGQTLTGFQSACRDVPTLLREQFGQMDIYQDLQQTIRIEISSGPYKGVYGNTDDAMAWPEWLIQGHCQ
jgi:hypothetical protein